MSRTKEFYATAYLDSRQPLEEALNQAEEELRFELFVDRLTENKQGQAVLSLIIDRLNELVRNDPNFFLTCTEKTLREYARERINE